MLATSARRGGYDVAVLDLFNDLDTRQIAMNSEKVPGHEQGLARFSGQALLQAASRLAPGDAYAGVVYGSGFEDDTALLGELAQGRRLYGNSVATINAIKDPRRAQHKVRMSVKIVTTSDSSTAKIIQCHFSRIVRAQ